MSKLLGLSPRLLSFLMCAALAALSTTTYAANGRYWQNVRATVAVDNIATNGKIYVASGSYAGNGLWTSTDLKTWTHPNLPGEVSARISSVVYENGIFFAIGNTIATSRDGINWSAADIPVSLATDFSAITFGNGMYVVVGCDDHTDKAVVLTSVDGKAWTSVDTGITISEEGRMVLDGVAWNGARFVAAGTFYGTGSGIVDIATTSTDGQHWSQVSLPADGSYGYTFSLGYGDALAYGNGIFVMGPGISLSGAGTGVYTSSDGLHWTARTLPDGFGGSAIQFVNGSFITPGKSSFFEPGDPRFGYLVSKNGIDWSFASPDSDNPELSTAAFTYAGKYVLASEAGVWSSQDLANWTHLFSGPQSSRLSCIGHGAGTYVVLGQLDGALTSGNGIDWPDEMMTVPADVYGYTQPEYSNGCIAHGPSGFVNRAFHSIDGINWEPSITPSGMDQISVVAYNGSKYLALVQTGSSPYVLQSADGATWTSVSHNLTLAFIDALKVIDGSFFAINQNNVFSSPDGAVWTNVTPPLSDMAGFLHIGYGNGILIAMWTDKNQHLKIATSTNGGANWTVEADAFPEGLVFTPISIAYGGGVYLATGYDYHRDTGAYIVSKDGVHWTFAFDNRISKFNAMLWDGTKFLAVGPFDILTSAGGMPSVLLNVSGDAPESVEPGQAFAITVTVSNDGSVRADDVVLNDTLPSSATYKSATASQGQCAKSGGTLTCELGVIAIGAEATVTLNFTAGSTEGDVTNKSSVGAYQSMRDDAALESSTTVTVKKPASNNSDNVGTVGSDSGGGGGAFGLLGFMSLLGFAMRRRMTSGE